MLAVVALHTALSAWRASLAARGLSAKDSLAAALQAVLLPVVDPFCASD